MLLQCRRSAGAEPHMAAGSRSAEHPGIQPRGFFVEWKAAFQGCFPVPGSLSSAHHPALSGNSFISEVINGIAGLEYYAVFRHFHDF